MTVVSGMVKSFLLVPKGSAAFLLKLLKLYSLLVHDMRRKMVQMGHIPSFLSLAHKFVMVFDFENML